MTNSTESNFSPEDELVTVLIPFSGGDYLPLAVSSILSQSYTRLEVIIVDDFSSPSARAELRGLKDNRLRVLRLHKKMGISAALNRGLFEARGALIARMDADDFSFPDRLTKQVLAMKEHPRMVACGSSVVTFGQKSRLWLFPARSWLCKLMLLRASCFAHPAVMYRAGVIADIGGYNPRFDGAEDYEAWSRMSRYGDFGNLRAPLLAYRIHQLQATQRAEYDVNDLRREISRKVLAEFTAKVPIPFAWFFGAFLSLLAMMLVLYLKLRALITFSFARRFA